MMNVGLDIGSTEFRSIRLDGNRLISRKIPACYCVLDDLTSNRRLLSQAQIPFSNAKNSLIIIGESALELAALVRCPVIPVFLEGHLPWNDPVGRQVCSQMIESLVPADVSGTSYCTMTESVIAGNGKEKARTFIENLLHLRGYQVSHLNSATALVLVELEQSGFSGMGISVGAESISVSITKYGTPLFESIYGHGFRSIEQKFALARHKYLWDAQGNQYLDLQSIQSWLRGAEISLDDPKAGDELWLAKECQQLLQAAMESMLTDLIRLSKRGEFKTRLPVVLSGGAAKMTGFDKIVEQVLQHSGVPLRILKMHIPEDTGGAVARGLLVNSTLSSQQANSHQSDAA